MTCMTTKRQFEAVNPAVAVLKNGRFAYRVECPWLGKNGKTLYAFKFCGQEAYNRYLEREESAETESERELSDPLPENAESES